MLTVRGTERFSSTIALAPVADPLRGQATQAFSEFFFRRRSRGLPRYGFASMSDTEFGAMIRLE